MEFDTPKARNFLEAIDLTDTPRRVHELSASGEAAAFFDQAKDQAQVIGASVFSFVHGITAESRATISDSALLAQLVANKRVPVDESPLEWFRVYSEVLGNIGWTIQDNAWTDYTTQGMSTVVHEKIIEVMAAALGPAPAALAVLATTRSALEAIAGGGSWLTLFTHEAQKARIARFQIGLVDRDPNGDEFVSSFAFLIEATNTITQILLFNFKSAKATFKANSMKASINPRARADLGKTIHNKIRAYQADYLSSVIDL